MVVVRGVAGRLAVWVVGVAAAVLPNALRNADAWVGPGDKVTVLLRKVRESSGSG